MGFTEISGILSMALVFRVTGVFLFVINLSQIANNNSNTENVYVFINQ